MQADALTIAVQVQRRKILMIRIVIAVLLIIVLGFYGIIFFFADLGPGESWFSRLAVAFTFYLVVTAIIAWLVYPRWQMGLLVLWGCLSVAILNLQTVVSEGTESKLNELALIVVPMAGSALGVSITSILKSRLAR
jgi:hypothetical protein